MLIFHGHIACGSYGVEFNDGADMKRESALWEPS